MYSFLTYTESMLRLFFWVCLFLGLDTPGLAMLTLLCALLHEGGHLCAMQFCGVSLSLPRAGFHGLLLPVGKTVSYRTDIFISAAGAGVNLLCALISFLWPAEGAVKEFLHLFGWVSLYTGLGNLLPAEGYDGERILSACLCLCTDADTAATVCEWTSFLTAALFCFLALFRLLSVGGGYWMFFVFFTSLLGKILRKTGGEK